MDLRTTHVAVVGGGIAGAGAAWALRRAGARVTLFEKGDELGGNARPFRWRKDGEEVETTLFVHAWPTRLYYTYNQLLERLGVETVEMPIKYYVRSDAGVFRQRPDTPLYDRLAGDFARWDRLLRAIHRVNAAFTPAATYESLYHFSFVNPMNLVPLYGLARAFGISDTFWDKVFVPIHCASFITTRLKTLPAVVGPLLEDVVPLERPCAMSTWTEAPREVFARMTEGVAVHTGHHITRVRRDDGAVHLSDAMGRSYEADRVVFACDARSTLEALEAPSMLERLLLSQIEYVDDDDATFATAVVHNDPAVLPEDVRDDVLADYNTYSEVKPDGGIECTFVLSPHTPALEGARQKCFVTFNTDKELKDVQAVVPLPRANHSFSLKNLTVMLALRGIQGRRGTWFCGSYTTPEGGHDLSLLSGLVVARAMGADYPLDPANEPAMADFRQLQRLMLGRAG